MSMVNDTINEFWDNHFFEMYKTKVNGKRIASCFVLLCLYIFDSFIIIVLKIRSLTFIKYIGGQLIFRLSARAIKETPWLRDVNVPL